MKKLLLILLSIGSAPAFAQQQMNTGQAQVEQHDLQSNPTNTKKVCLDSGKDGIPICANIIITDEKEVSFELHFNEGGASTVARVHAIGSKYAVYLNVTEGGGFSVGGLCKFFGPSVFPSLSNFNIDQESEKNAVKVNRYQSHRYPYGPHADRALFRRFTNFISEPFYSTYYLKTVRCYGEL